MNRRELFKGLGALLVVANMPLPVQALIELPEPEALRYLKRLQLDLLEKIVNPPCIMHENGTIERMSIVPQQECLAYIDGLIREMSNV